MNGMRYREAKLVNSYFGDVFTKRFLASKHVVMVSEGDFISRLKICVRAVFLMPVYALYVALFTYYKVIVSRQMSNLTDGATIKLFRDQGVVIDSMLIVTAVHLLIVAFALIVMLNKTMGPGVQVITMIFNVIYILEALFYGSFIYIFDAAGLIDKFKSAGTFIETLKTQWIWVLVYLIGMISYFLIIGIFKDLNTWNREWIRIDRYRKTEDRENAFIFKTWVTPGEISARKLIVATGWLFILASNAMDLFDAFGLTGFDVLKYLILACGYASFIGSFVVPYSKWSLIYYWGVFLFVTVILIYGLYHIQNTAWQSGNFFQYSYLAVLLPFLLSLIGAIRYTWTVRNREEIQAIVINEFESSDEFEEYVAAQSAETQGTELLTAEALDV